MPTMSGTSTVFPLIENRNIRKNNAIKITIEIVNMIITLNIELNTEFFDFPIIHQ